MGLEVLGLGNEELGIDNGRERLGRQVAGLFPLQGSQVRLDTIVLVELGFDVVVNVLKLLLQVIYELPQRPISSVPDLVPLEGSYIASGRF